MRLRIVQLSNGKYDVQRKFLWWWNSVLRIPYSDFATAKIHYEAMLENCGGHAVAVVLENK